MPPGSSRTTTWRPSAPRSTRFQSSQPYAPPWSREHPLDGALPEIRFVDESGVVAGEHVPVSVDDPRFDASSSRGAGAHGYVFEPPTSIARLPPPLMSRHQ